MSQRGKISSSMPPATVPRRALSTPVRVGGELVHVHPHLRHGPFPPPSPVLYIHTQYMHRLPPPRTVHSSPVNARRLRSPPRAALPIPAPTSSTRRDAFRTSARSRPPANCKTPPMARQWCMGKFPPSLPGCERPPVFIDSSTVCTQLRCDHVCFLSLRWAVHGGTAEDLR